GRAKAVAVWNVAPGRELLNLKGHTEQVENVAFSPDGGYLASASWDKTAKIWDTANGEEFASSQIPSSGRTDNLLSLTFSPDGRFLATGSDDNTVRLWDVAARMESITLTQPKPVTAVCFSPDGQTLLAGLCDG